MTITAFRLGIAIGFMLLPVSAAAQPARVIVCHVPPGHPSNAHALSLPDSAVQAHLAHGDVLGWCEDRRSRGGPPAGNGETKQRQPSVDRRGDGEADSNAGRGKLNSVDRTGQDDPARKKKPDTATAGNSGCDRSERGGRGQGERGGAGQDGRSNQREVTGGRQSEQGQPTGKRELNSGGQPTQGKTSTGGGRQPGNNNPQQDQRRVDQAPGGRRDASGGTTNPQSGSGRTGNSGPAPKKKR